MEGSPLQGLHTLDSLIIPLSKPAEVLYFYNLFNKAIYSTKLFELNLCFHMYGIEILYLTSQFDITQSGPMSQILLPSCIVG